MAVEIQYPLSRIFIGSDKTVAICASQIFVLDSKSGTVEASATVSSAEKNVSSVVRIAAVDETYQHLVTSGDDKRLRVWDVNHLKELSCREIPKRANVLKLSQDGQTILVADKFGDIFSYPLVPPEPAQQPQPAEIPGSKSVAVAMHDNPHGTLILGHASIITDFVLTHGEKQVISADRDEHVRVSWYPEGWDVDRYCLGHRKFVSALEIPLCAPSILISGGGDPELYVWEYKVGKNIARIPVWDYVRPFIKVKNGRRRPEKPQGKKNKKKAVEEGVAEDVEMIPESGEEVLVVSKISTVQLGEENVVVFSAVGSSALFYFTWPSSLDFGAVQVGHFDLTNPVTDFTVAHNGILWASVDPTWTTAPGAVNATESTNSKRVRRLVWKGSEIVEDESDSQLAQGLDQGCDVKGPASETHTLSLYEHLISLPKTAEFDSADGGEDVSVPTDITSGPGLRASARQKTKEELEKRKALTQEAARATKQPRVEET
ncbi:tRNA (guanine-N(7)-)-methyltransferase subunit TRM82 AltName: Full=Transfer RNA methyltransferase 82 [Rhizoctonia solani AG-1 IB]|uniref:Rhizoctonia solani AG1-IB WGS project CAOJ00000000 data, isolate 7/3/14, contig 10341 n=1 Tax=Thanatephorus cucumeris (strain AG1-IB / isolate 7/3/14) TaxID=1108050 RepID=M5C4K9_THACB|nr:tRNA (guanine-N(7)-)-methyltransferase subunit TRM82 AltName: Full=Transfer RNA methyltransferase 82 [Rhizoctonia solani AG-1 IB]